MVSYRIVWYRKVSYGLVDWVLEDRKISRQTSKDRLQMAEKF